MTIAEDVFQDLQLVQKSLVNETGILKWVASFGVSNYALTLSLKRLTKDDEFLAAVPYGRNTGRVGQHFEVSFD